MRPIVDVKRAIDAADPNDQTTLFNLVATWETKLKEVLETQGTHEFQNVFWECAEQTAIAVKSPLATGDPDWEYAEELIEAYPVQGTDHAHTPVVNAIGAGIVEARFAEERSVDNVPPFAIEYLLSVGRSHPSSVPWEDAFAVGWAIDHPQVDVVEELTDVISQEPMFVMGANDVAWNASCERALELTKNGVLSDETIETILWVDNIDAVTDPKSPRAPRYHSASDHYAPLMRVDPEIKDELMSFLDDNEMMGAVEHHGLLTEI